MDFCARTARRAGDLTLEHFGTVSVELKGDGSEVTAADRDSEALIRAAIAEEFPADAIMGEEGTGVTGSSGRRWIIDPIDGTRSFAAGVPLYGVLIALEVAGEPVLGCCHLPALNATLVAALGAGAWINGRPAQVSDCDDIGAARVLTSGLEYWRDWSTPAAMEGFEELVRTCRFARTWGDCYGYFLIATGRAEIMVDPACGALWDCAPLLPILQEAGGRYTTLGGGPVRPWSSALATNALLHGAAVACWGGGDDLYQRDEILRRQEG